MESPDLNLAALQPLVELLSRKPSAFDFFQAVRVLERRWPERSTVGEFGDPQEEVVHFSVNPDMFYPPAELDVVELPDAETDGPARMAVNFLGLNGASGVLPHEYSQLILERLRAHDHGLADFLDMFHHRLISLFYRAWRKYRITVAHELGRDDRLSEHVLDLVGLGLEHYRQLLPFSDELLIYYSGLFGLQFRAAVSLEQLLADFFDVPVQVEQFVGGWYSLSRGDWCYVGEELGASTQLGLGAVVGDEIWDQQSRARIRLGPLSRGEFERFLPGGRAHEQLRGLARFFSHDQFDFDLQLVLERADVPGFVLGEADTTEQRLGWSTWIRTRPRSQDAEETILRL